MAECVNCHYDPDRGECEIRYGALQVPPHKSNYYVGMDLGRLWQLVQPYDEPTVNGEPAEWTYVIQPGDDIRFHRTPLKPDLNPMPLPPPQSLLDKLLHKIWP